MSEICQFADHIMLLADYKDPKLHKHLATHVMLSLGEKMDWYVNGEHIKCRGICIGPDVWHAGNSFHGETLVFLFSQISNYAWSLREQYLCKKPYLVLDDQLVEQAVKEYQIYKKESEKNEKNDQNPKVQNLKDQNPNGQEIDHRILAMLGISDKQPFPYEERVKEVFAFVSQLETIDRNTIEILSENACLSKSRLSHLFREQTGMTLHSYLALKKVYKTYEQIREGKSITESCLAAGFASPSHCAATCKRMFGISITDFSKK